MRPRTAGRCRRSSSPWTPRRSNGRPSGGGGAALRLQLGGPNPEGRARHRPGEGCPTKPASWGPRRLPEARAQGPSPGPLPLQHRDPPGRARSPPRHPAQDRDRAHVREHPPAGAAGSPGPGAHPRRHPEAGRGASGGGLAGRAPAAAGVPNPTPLARNLTVLRRRSRSLSRSRRGSNRCRRKERRRARLQAHIAALRRYEIPRLTTRPATPTAGS